MSHLLPNRQTNVNANFAYLALERFCHTGKIPFMEAPNRIRELREAREMTIEDVADATGLSVSYASRLERGERNLSVKNLNLFASAFGVDPGEVLAKNSTGQRPSNIVAVMGRIGAGAEIDPGMEQLPADGLYEIETPFPLPADAIAFEVSGESMWPRYDPGDIIICWRQGTDANEVLGWEAAVKTADGKRFLKRVLRGATAGTFDLESHNAPPVRGVSIEWVASIQSVIRSGQWRKLGEDGRRRLMRKMTAA